MGWGSAIVDNVPLTAVAIDTIPTSDSSLWSLLAYTVGTGGSHLIIGSAAGVVVMGRMNALTSLAYMRIAALPVLVACHDLGGSNRDLRLEEVRGHESSWSDRR